MDSGPRRARGRPLRVRTPAATGRLEPPLRGDRPDVGLPPAGGPDQDRLRRRCRAGRPLPRRGTDGHVRPHPGGGRTASLGTSQAHSLCGRNTSCSTVRTRHFGGCSALAFSIRARAGQRAARAPLWGPVATLRQRCPEGFPLSEVHLVRLLWSASTRSTSSDIDVWHPACLIQRPRPSAATPDGSS